MVGDKKYQALFPNHWTRSEAPTTAQFLQQFGARALLQHGSGTGLDALRAGVPVIDIRRPGEVASYPYLENSIVMTAANSRELADRCGRFTFDQGKGVLRNFALSWSAYSATESAERIVHQLMDIPDTLPEQPILDGWQLSTG
jgi:hypothetical protein